MRKLINWLDYNPINNGFIILIGIGITNILLFPNVLIRFGIEVPADILTQFNNIRPYLVIPGGLLCIVGVLGYIKWFLNSKRKTSNGETV